MPALIVAAVILVAAHVAATTMTTAHMTTATAAVGSPGRMIRPNDTDGR